MLVTAELLHYETHPELIQTYVRAWLNFLSKDNAAICHFLL